MSKTFEKRFQILDLNEINVLALYKDCLVPKEELGKNPDNEIRTKIFDMKSCGKDSPEFVFDKSYIEAHFATIKYLLGQTKVCHEQLGGFTIPMGAMKYTDRIWVKDNSALLALYYLGVAAEVLPKFSKSVDGKNIASSLKFTVSAISPADPEFRMQYNKDPNAYVPDSLYD